jgi:Protein of unknown function (DUF3455)
MRDNRGYAWALVLLPLSAAGCNDSVALNEPITAESQSLSRPCPPDTPKELAVPDGNELSLSADAEGAQVYFCQTVTDPKTNTSQNKWVLDHPDALLFGKGGRVIAHHYDGPTWEGLDNSTVHGARIANVVVNDSTIDLLLLKADAHSGDGIFSKVTYIQRLNTEGGKPASPTCEKLTDRVRVPYTATYYFYTAATGGGHSHH